MSYYYFPYMRSLRAQQNEEAAAPIIPRPPKSEIKKQLKVVVSLSNIIQDENNKLKSMKDAYLPFKDILKQRLLIGNLSNKQNQAIKQLEYLESFYYGGKNNRFFYFIDKPIYWP